MDTKSKKFDRTFITKPIAFLLAVLLAVFACVYTLRQALFLEQDVDGAGVYVSDFLRGIDRDDVTKMYSFANENRTVQETALQRYLYGDGSKKAYDSYKESCKAGKKSKTTNYIESFASYEAFHNAYEDAKRRGNAYKNMLFAVVDDDTDKAVSNVAELDGKKVTEDDLRPFTKSMWNYQIYLLTGNWSGSQAATDDIADNDFLSQSMIWFLQSGELHGTLYVTFDQTLAKADAFSDHLAEYSVTSTLLKHTLTVDLLCLLGILICTVYLIIRAGRRASDCVRGNRRYSDALPAGCRRRDDEMRMMGADRIFTLLRTVLDLGAAAAFCVLAFFLVEYFFDEGAGAQLLMYLGVGLCAAAVAVLLLDWTLYLARHIKNGTLLSNLFLVWLWKKGKALLQKLKAVRTARPKAVRDLLNDSLSRVLLMGFVPNFILGLLIVVFASDQAFGPAILLIFLIFVYDSFLAGYICFYAYHLRTVIAAIHRMREGDLHVQIDTTRMPPPVRAFADDVMQLQQGLQTAIENALRDARTKTELITNVSHDLKTPLTSIINYVDLLSRCRIEDETAREYLAVLGEKSDRLKKLIEDLVEASKASAGAIKADLTTVSLNELSAQLLGEYADAFAARNLTVIEKGNDMPILVRADSKLCCRVLDNLFGNVKKYAMPGTRVYLTLEQTDGRGVLTLRNISEQPLDISAEELRERFVRGDKSRSTEGSGLGLSIAEDLCRLQGAVLSLSVEGDLFTASVAFASENDPPFNEI